MIKKKKKKKMSEIGVKYLRGYGNMIFKLNFFFDFIAFLNFFTIKSCVLNKSAFSKNTDFQAFKICFRISLY